MRQVGKVVAGVMLGVIFAALGVTAANADEIPSDGEYGVLDPRVERTEYQQWERVRVAFDFAVPDDAQPGDTMALQLPEAFSPSSVAPFTVTSPDGAAIADATVSPDGIVTLTLTDFVLGYDDVVGEAFLFAEFRDDLVPVGEESTTVLLFEQTVTVLGDEATPHALSPDKYGWWVAGQSSAIALDDNGALLNPAGPHITWAVVLRAGAWSTLEVRDTLDGATTFCADGSPIEGFGPRLEARDIRSGGLWDEGAPVPVSVTVDAECHADGSVSFTVSKPADVQHLQFRLVYDVRLITDAAGRPLLEAGGVGVASAYTNAATVTYPDGSTDALDGIVETMYGGGSGWGATAPAIDIEKYSGTWAGVVYADGRALLGADGQPLPQPEGDFDSGLGLLLDAGASTDVTFRITNTGIEPLTSIAVRDSTMTGPALGPISCSIDGVWSEPATAVDLSAVVLEPGEWFECRAELAALEAGVAHGDVATVEAMGLITGLPVTDADAWNAHTPAVPVTETPAPSEPAPSEPAPSEPAAEPTPTPGAGGASELPRTGMGIEGGLIAGALLLLAGGLLVGLRARRA